VTTKDIKNSTLKVVDLSPGTLASLQGAQGDPGPAGPAGPAGDPGPAGAADLPVTRQSGGITATTLGTGTYCVEVPGLVAANSSAVASIEWLASSTGGSTSAFIEVNFNGGAWPANAFGVRTYTRNFSVANAPFTDSDQPFFIMITP